MGIHDNSSLPPAPKSSISAESAEDLSFRPDIGAGSSAPINNWRCHCETYKRVLDGYKSMHINTMARKTRRRQTSAEETFGADSDCGTQPALDYGSSTPRWRHFPTPQPSPSAGFCRHSEPVLWRHSAERPDPRCSSVPSRQNTHTGSRRQTARGFFVGWAGTRLGREVRNPKHHGSS